MIPGPSIEYEEGLEGNGCELHNDDPDEDELLNISNGKDEDD